MNAITQRVTAIHACRSISAAPEAIHKQDDLNVGAAGAHRSHLSAARDRDPVLPRGDSEKDGAIPAMFREENRTARALRGSKPSRSVGIFNWSGDHREKRARVKRAID